MHTRISVFILCIFTIAAFLIGGFPLAASTPSVPIREVEIGFFAPGSPNGCFLMGKEGWVHLAGNKIACPNDATVKTDETGWGTIIYSFANITLRPGSEVRFVPGGLTLTNGTFRAFVHRSPQGFRFRTPQATLGIRGTVFTAGASGSVSVEAGSVQVTPNTGSPEILTVGQSTGTVTVSSLPEVLKTIETALQAEHDKKPAEAAAAFAKAFSDKSLDGMTEYRDNLLQQFVKNLVAAAPAPDDPLVQQAAAALKTLPETWYKILEALLSKGDAAGLKTLAGLSNALHPLNPRDPRDQIARGLLADAVQNRLALSDAAKKLLGANGLAVGSTTTKLQGFWSDSLVYVKTLAAPQTVLPGEATRLLSPAALANLAPAAAKKRIQAATTLPRNVLEVKGLYYLVRAYLLDGRYDDALQIMSFFEKHYPGSTWLERARTELAQYRLRVVAQSAKRAAVASHTKRLSSKHGKTVKQVEGVFIRQAQQAGASGLEATGKVASGAQSLTGTPENPDAAGSLQEGY
ncbi:MAG: hypothetical protein WA705_15280 [Candidatus Ozemobacteraceae bacterium]